MSDRARVAVVGDHINVVCADEATRVVIEDDDRSLRNQISTAVFAHERACGKCDPTAAYEQGDPAYVRDVDVPKYIEERVEEQRDENERMVAGLAEQVSSAREGIVSDPVQRCGKPTVKGQPCRRLLVLSGPHWICPLHPGPLQSVPVPHPPAPPSRELPPLSWRRRKRTDPAS